MYYLSIVYPLQVLSRSTLLTAINDSRARPHVDMSTQPPARAGGRVGVVIFRV